MKGVQLIQSVDFKGLIESAKNSPRKRTNFNFHQSMDENPHRFLNVLTHGTYIRPHRHMDPPKPEGFLILEGECAFLIFDENGNVVENHVLGREGLWGIDIAAGIYHTLICLTPHAVCYEIKPGPYKVSTDKDFAPWAPLEGSAEVASYMRSLVTSELT